MEFQGLEHKFCSLEAVRVQSDGLTIEGYASLFGKTDRGGDVVAAGAYGGSLRRLADSGGRVKMLWQHDPTKPIGVWDEVTEDAMGLKVKGRLLPDVALAREAAALLGAGAIDGLSIGYRTIRASKSGAGRRQLDEVELWEVSLVTFPMLPDARVGAKADETETSEDAAATRDLAKAIEAARLEMGLGT